MQAANHGLGNDPTTVGRQLGVRYLLEGSVRKAGDRVRITSQLIDAATGAHIWTDRFDGALSDIFDLQDRVTASVVGAIEPKWRHAEIERARAQPTESIDAYDLFLFSVEKAYATMSRLVLSTNASTAARSLAGTLKLSSVASRWPMKVRQSLSLMPMPLCDVFMSRPT